MDELTPEILAPRGLEDKAGVSAGAEARWDTLLQKRLWAIHEKEPVNGHQDSQGRATEKMAAKRVRQKLFVTVTSASERLESDWQHSQTFHSTKQRHKGDFWFSVEGVDEAEGRDREQVRVEVTMVK